VHVQFCGDVHTCTEPVQFCGDAHTCTESLHTCIEFMPLRVPAGWCCCITFCPRPAQYTSTGCILTSRLLDGMCTFAVYLTRDVQCACPALLHVWKVASLVILLSVAYCKEILHIGFQCCRRQQPNWPQLGKSRVPLDDSAPALSLVPTDNVRLPGLRSLLL
jgi:hypothetical protein